MHIIEECIGHQNKDNGCMILSYLINHYGNITDIDVSKAKERWEQTLWNNKDTMDTYAQCFKKPECHQRRYSGKNYMLPTKDQATMKFLLLLVTSLPKTHGMRPSIPAKHAKCQTDMATYGKLDTNIATLQFEFFQQQLTEEAHIDGNDHQEYHHSHRPSRPLKHSHVLKPSKNQRQHAYVAQTKKYNVKVKCWGCKS
jgi:hypothetical protein